MSWNEHHCDSERLASEAELAKGIAQPTKIPDTGSCLRERTNRNVSSPTFDRTTERTKMKILFLAANPVDVVSRLRIDKEFREIRRKIHLGTHGNQLEIVLELAVRANDLPEALLRHQPDIVHFSGHGSEIGEIFLEDEAGNRKAVSIEALSDLFRILKGNIRMVVLNACYALEQAKALSETIDFTIGMNDAIDDRAAITFSSQFYQSLAFGRSVKEAFELAVNQLRLEGFDDASVPELQVREGVSASLSRIVKPRVASLGFWLFASLAIILTLDILRRFMGGEGGWWDISVTFAQPLLIFTAALAVCLIATSLMHPVNLLVEKVARFARFNEPHKARRVAISTGIVLGSAFGIWLSLPAFARYYNEKGFEFQHREPTDLSRARESYQLAVRLKPNYAQAHYNLAAINEDLHPEKALEGYLLAIRYDSQIYPAYNNLARLYLRRGTAKDYENALTILSQASDLAPQDENVQYSLYKNFGWANYALTHYVVAETYLRRAISLRGGEGAAAHCLLAYVLKEQGKTEAVDECYDCVRFAPGEKDVEAKWVSDAQECFMKEDRK
jgi:hypothetical protein